MKPNSVENLSGAGTWLGPTRTSGTYLEEGSDRMMCSRILKTLTTAILVAAVAACSKAPAGVNPCNLLTVTEAQSIQGSIAEAKWFPRKKGEANELCMYFDGKGEAHLMLFVFDDKAADPLTTIQSGTKGGADRFVEVTGVGEKAAAGFGPPDDSLKLFAARSRAGVIGIRVRQTVNEDDEKFNELKMLTVTALGRMK
jgi:hypothetical protein